MTGEMYESDVTSGEYPLHFAIAEALGGTVRPFDMYQGPYVVIGEDIRCGADPYAYCPRGLGVQRLWICSDDGCFGQVYNEANEKLSEPFPLECSISSLMVIDAAQSVLIGEELSTHVADNRQADLGV